MTAFPPSYNLASSGSVSSLGPPLLLIVNDIPEQSEIMSVLLRQAGYEVRSAASAQEGLALAEQMRLDMIISDVSMPGMDGIELCRHLRANSNLDLTPILLVSAVRKDSESAVAGLKAGADDYLEAPYDPFRLIAHVERLLSRYRTEAALKASQQQLQFIADTAPVYLAHCNVQKRFAFVNQRYVERFGLRREDVIGERIIDVLGPEAYESIREYVETALRGHSVQFETEVPYRQLGTRWMHASYVPEFHADGTVSGFVAVITDITERKLAENALRESERQLAEAQHIAGFGSWAWDVQTNKVTWSDELYHIFGLKPKEFPATYEAFLDRVHPEDRASVKQTVDQALLDGNAFTYECCIVRKDGAVRHIFSRGEVVRDEAGRIMRMSGIGQDITERKRVEEQLRHQLDFTRAITGNLGEGVIAVDKAGRVIFMNPTAEELLGWTKEELDGQVLHNVIHYQYADGRQIPLAECRIMNVLVSGEKAVLRMDEDVFTRKDGSTFPVSCTATPIITEGQLLGVVQVFHDITERKKAEAALQEAEEQLRQSQKMEAVGKLAGGVAHDFNNLLTAITGYADLSMRKLREGDPLFQNLAEIHKAAERAASLTRQLLAFSRKQVLQPKILDVNTIVSGMKNMLVRLIGEDIELRTMLDPALGSIKADPGQIEQVLMNLVVNARDAMPRGGKLTIETGNVYLDQNYANRHIAVAPGSYVMLGISDTGMGMDAEIQEQIFEPFFTTKERGTGLGLSTVYGIIKQSEGDIWVYSEPGEGTTFKIYLPRVDEVASSPEMRTKVKTSQRGTETIMVVEDEEMVRRLACETLKMEGYKVIEAANGGEALLTAQRHGGSIDLMLTDVVMPKMSGRELVDQLTVLRPSMRAIYMSGYTDDAILHHGRLEQGVHFIEKPFTPDALVQKVREVLDAK